MSAKERERSYLVHQAVDGRLGQRDASERLGIGVRQFRRLVARWKRDGDAGLVSRQRGRVPNNRVSDEVRGRIAVLLKDRTSAQPWRRRSCWNWTGSRFRGRRSGGCKWS
jgi:transposase